MYCEVILSLIAIVAVMVAIAKIGEPFQSCWGSYDPNLYPSEIARRV